MCCYKLNKIMRGRSGGRVFFVWVVKGGFFEEVIFKLNFNDEKGSNEIKISGENVFRRENEWMECGVSLCWRSVGSEGRR